MNTIAKAIVCSFIVFSPGIRAGDVTSFDGESTVNDFALQCQHAGMKSSPTERNRECVTLINGAKSALGLAKGSTCTKTLQSIPPLDIADVMFHLATIKSSRNANAALTMVQVIKELAPMCR